MTSSNTPTARRRRQCGPKTRSGCLTCKIRRVKCDEAKPSCNRCSSTGRKCDGYANLSNPTFTPGQSKAVLVRTFAQVPGSTKEKRAFSHYITRTALELEGFYTSGFWDALLLQTSHAEPALRHAVIAISALHEDFASNSLVSVPASERQNFSFALNQYTKAIGHLRRSLASGKQAPLTALMSCILFVCFDSIRGYYQTSMVHLQSGMRILKDLRAQALKQGTKLDSMIEDIIAPLLLRLGLQSILYIDTSDPQDRILFATELSQAVPRNRAIPEEFATLEEARLNINECADGLFRMFYLSDGNIPLAFQAEETRTLHAQYATRIREWNISFEKFMNRYSKSFTSRQVRGAALVKIHHTVVRIMSDMTSVTNDDRPMNVVSNAPMGFAKYTTDFQIIINLCRSLITAAEVDAKAGRPPLTFSTDLGIVGPLYYVGVKSVSPNMKREAIELLQRCPRKEGMWDSVTSVKLISKFWEIEERQKALQGGGSSDPNSPVQINDVVDLVFYEGGEWQWVWKELVPSVENPRSSRIFRYPTPTSSYAQDLEDGFSSSRSSTPRVFPLPHISAAHSCIDEGFPQHNYHHEDLGTPPDHATAGSPFSSRVTRVNSPASMVMQGTDEDGEGIGSRIHEILALRRVSAVDGAGILPATGNQWGQWGPGTG